MFFASDITVSCSSLPNLISGIGPNLICDKASAVFVLGHLSIWPKTAWIRWPGNLKFWPPVVLEVLLAPRCPCGSNSCMRFAGRPLVCVRSSLEAMRLPTLGAHSIHTPSASLLPSSGEGAKQVPYLWKTVSHRTSLGHSMCLKSWQFVNALASLHRHCCCD